MVNELTKELKNRGAPIIKIADISMLAENQNHGYETALLLGIPLSSGYLFHLSNANSTDCSEFSEKETAADRLADWAADYIAANGYPAFSQSENNLKAHDFYDDSTKSTTLPHKTIAVLTGMGWIGKNDLLVTRDYGSALCMCTVLTNAPLPADNPPIVLPQCGECTVCTKICPPGALHGVTWSSNISRDTIANIYVCKCCLKCLVQCPWTQKYIQNNL